MRHEQVDIHLSRKGRAIHAVLAALVRVTGDESEVGVFDMNWMRDRTTGRRWLELVAELHPSGTTPKYASTPKETAMAAKKASKKTTAKRTTKTPKTAAPRTAKKPAKKVSKK